MAAENREEIGDAEEEIEEAKPTIDERIAELKAVGTSEAGITRALYQEGYSTHDIMKRKLPLASLRKKATKDDSVIDAIAGTTKGPGYLDEFKIMIQQQISRSRELTDIFYNVGMGTLLASLSKSGIKMADFRKIALTKEGLREALESAGETAFKALEYYQSDKIVTVERERDEARSFASILETKVNELVDSLDPKLRLEKMIQAYLFSGNAEPDTLMSLIDKWLAMETAEIKMSVIA